MHSVHVSATLAPMRKTSERANRLRILYLVAWTGAQEQKAAEASLVAASMCPGRTVGEGAGTTGGGPTGAAVSAIRTRQHRSWAPELEKGHTALELECEEAYTRTFMDASFGW